MSLPTGSDIAEMSVSHEHTLGEVFGSRRGRVAVAVGGTGFVLQVLATLLAGLYLGGGRTSPAIGFGVGILFGSLWIIAVEFSLSRVQNDVKSEPSN